MLSNKLTFSLVFVLALALIAAPAFAQVNTISGDLNVDTDRDGDSGEDFATRTFLVVQRNSEPANGIIGAVSPGTAGTVVQVGFDFPDLDSLLKFGGTIELIASDTDYAKFDLVISEIMWGNNPSGTDANSRQAAQWIEIYNQRATLASTVTLHLLFTTNKKVTRDTVRLTSAGTLPVVTTGGVEYKVVDSVFITDPEGQSGRTVGTTTQGIENFISMYRKRSLNADGSDYNYDGDGKPAGDVFKNGQDAGQWIASASNARINIGGTFVGTPGNVHVTRAGGGGTELPDGVALGGQGVIFNEIRNDTTPRPRQVDWIELINNNREDRADRDPTVSVSGWRIRLVTTDADGNNHQKVIATLPDYRIPPGGTLLIVGEDPARTHLARGIDLSEERGRRGDDRAAGAKHAYYRIPEGLYLPDDKQFLLVLKSGDSADTDKQFVDYAGNHFISVPRVSDMWPLKGKSKPKADDIDEDAFGDDTATFATASNDLSFGRSSELQQVNPYERKYRAKVQAHRLHKDDWVSFGEAADDPYKITGIGYDPKTDPRNAPGSPGYGNHGGITDIFDDANNSSPTDNYTFGGRVSISEIMYHAGRNWNLVQWIELFNSSMDQAVDIGGWELEIRNQTDVRSYVDAIIEFDENTIIGPNQTLLIVADSVGAAISDRIPRSRIYNLYARHRSTLGLLRRHGTLLSKTAFHINIKAKEVSREGDIRVAQDLRVVDEAGNLPYDPATGEINRDEPLWTLPELDADGRRRSLVRLYEDNMGAGNRSPIETGINPPRGPEANGMPAWRKADLSTDILGLGGIGSVHYGHSDDIATPGHGRTSPLPVSLSSFRPVRDDVTGHVVVRWATESELNNAGFNILRSETKTGEFKVVNVKGIVPGHGTTSEKHVYEWTDTTAKPNVVYYYQIEDVSLDGNRTTLVTTRLKGHVSAAGKVTTTWGDLKHRD